MPVLALMTFAIMCKVDYKRNYSDHDRVQLPVHKEGEKEGRHIVDPKCHVSYVDTDVGVRALGPVANKRNQSENQNGTPVKIRDLQNFRNGLAAANHEVLAQVEARVHGHISRVQLPGVDESVEQAKKEFSLLNEIPAHSQGVKRRRKNSIACLDFLHDCKARMKQRNQRPSSCPRDTFATA